MRSHTKTLEAAIKATVSKIALLAAELNKLKKNELIDIILTFKLPVAVNNVQLINYVSKFGGSDVKQGSDDVDKLHNTSENKICIHCEQLAKDHSALKKELDCEDLILLLKQLNNSDERVPITASIDNDLNSTISPRPESSLAKKSEAIPQKTFSAALKSNRDNTEQKHDKYKGNKNASGDSKWNPPSKNNEHKYRPIFGCNDRTEFKTVPRTGHLHVSRIGADMT
ncbi:hypothetical protein JTB14_008453 [Gonioctena quinquepunctata]|nr:hypothetical protein JTB14_008453 [Gonioctena quinquepunctata]